MSTLPLPLEGLRVIDLAEVWAGPMAASLLGDLGAEVIKVESFPRAPQTRPTAPPANAMYYLGGPDDPRPWDRSATHNMANRNKLGIALNLRDPRGKDLFKGLVRIADVLIEGYSAGTVARLGLDYPVLSGVNPGLVMVSMPGWGTEGPYEGYVTLGSGIDATSGHHHVRGYPECDATHTPSCVHSDAVAAATAAVAAITGLFHRRRSGKGQWVDLSQQEAFLPHLAYPLLDYAMNGRLAPRLGNHDRWMAPHNVYRCKGEDAWIAICIETDQQWEALCQAAGHPEWAKDPRCSGALVRYQHQEELDRLIGAWTEGFDRQTLARVLQAGGIPAGAVLRDIELLDDPHLNERGLFQEASHPTIGTHRYPGTLWKFAETPMGIRIAANALGQHNTQVLQELLGVSPAEYQELEKDGVVGDSYNATAQLDPRDQALAQSALR